MSLPRAALGRRKRAVTSHFPRLAHARILLFVTCVSSSVTCAPDNIAPPATAPIPLLAGDRPVVSGAETRHALRLDTQQQPKKSFVTRLPPRAELRFGFAVPNTHRGKRHGTSAFELTVEHERTRTRVLRRRTRTDASTWTDVHVDLERFSEHAVTIEFAITPEEGDDTRTPIAIANPTVVSRNSVTTRPNLVIVSIDTLRAQNVGSYGYARNTTPFLDALAAQGVRFANAITTATTTAPAHMSLFTGLYPVRHGIRVGYAPSSASHSLAETLRRAGYHTAAFTENGFVRQDLGFRKGFLEYLENRSPHFEGAGEAAKTFGQARRWLARRPREPFFLFIHTYQVHAPFFAPPGYGEFFNEPLKNDPAAPALRAQRDDYDREIRYTDDQLRAFGEALSEAGLGDSTLLVVLSDHGEEFGEHGAFQHGTTVFEESLRVPLIMTGPAIPTNTRIDTPVSLIDVFPTLLELLDIPQPGKLDGMSLAATIRGKSGLPARTLYAEGAATRRWTAPFHGIPWAPPIITARTQNEKFIFYEPWDGTGVPPRHYDLMRDPNETNPEVLSPRDRIRAETLLHEYRDAAETPPDLPGELSDDLRARLESLGYLAPPVQ